MPTAEKPSLIAGTFNFIDNQRNKILLGLNFTLILLSYFPENWNAWIKETIWGLNVKSFIPINVAAMAWLLIKPLIRTSEDASFTRTCVSDLPNLSKTVSNMDREVSELERKSTSTLENIREIHEKVHQLGEPYVNVEQNELETILLFIRKYSNSKIYLGFIDTFLVQNLLSLLKDDNVKRFILYIHPEVLDHLLEIGSDMVEEIIKPEKHDCSRRREGKKESKNIYIIDCPRDSCTLFAKDSYNKVHCIIIRYSPDEGTCWSATTEPGSPYAQYLYDTYNEYYKKDRVRLNSYFKAICIQKIYSNRSMENIHIRSGDIKFASREKEYEMATECVRSAKKSILAVDFMPPSLWTSGDMRNYIEAHKVSICPEECRIRICIFPTDIEKLKQLSSDYEAYVKLNGEEMKMNLHFLRKDIAENKGIKKGFIIIDDEIVFVSVDAQERNESGMVNFNRQDITDLRDKFMSILPLYCSDTVSDEVFLRSMS